MRTAWMILAACLTLGGVARAVEPLSENQRLQLAQTVDQSLELDMAGWYALFANVLSWEKPAPGAIEGQIPDYDAILRSPEKYRGELFRVEGWLGGAPQPVAVRRPGPWEENLQQWSVLVSTDPDRVMLCYLLDPMPIGDAPKPGRRVSIVGRFYKVWQFVNLQGTPTAYPVFVGRWVRTSDEQFRRDDKKGAGQSTGSTEVGWSNVAWLVGLVVAAMLFMLWRARNMPRGVQPLPSQLRRRQERMESGVHYPTPDDDDDIELPPDPEAALGRLSSLHDHTMLENQPGRDDGAAGETDDREDDASRHDQGEKTR